MNDSVCVDKGFFDDFAEWTDRPKDPLRCIIAGSRSFCHMPEPKDRKYIKNAEQYQIDMLQYDEDYQLLCETMDQFELLHGPVDEVVSGVAEGADLAGERWAKENNKPIKQFKAQWWKHGKRAGVIRNEEMKLYANALVIFIRNNSKGSTHMYNIAKKKGMKIIRVDAKSLIYDAPE